MCKCKSNWIVNIKASTYTVWKPFSNYGVLRFAQTLKSTMNTAYNTKGLRFIFTFSTLTFKYNGREAPLRQLPVTIKVPPRASERAMLANQVAKKIDNNLCWLMKVR